MYREPVKITNEKYRQEYERIFKKEGMNQLFGHYFSWYRSKFAEYKYNLGQGESLWGEVESLVATGGIVGMLILVIERYTGWLVPWPMAIIFGVAMRIFKIYIGYLDRKYLKTGQAISEYPIQHGLLPKQSEQLDRIKKIEKKVAPETYEEYKTYL